MQGCLAQVGFGFPLYNACICSYYLLQLRYRVSEDTVIKRILPFMHACALFVAFTPAIAAGVIDLDGFDGILGCWINEGVQWRCYCDYNDNKQSGLTAVYEGFDKFGCNGEPLL